MRQLELITSDSLNENHFTYRNESGRPDLLRINKSYGANGDASATVWNLGDFAIYKYVINIPASEFTAQRTAFPTFKARKLVNIDPTESNYYSRLFVNAEILHVWQRPSNVNRDIPIVGTVTVEGMNKREDIYLNVVTTTRIATNVVVTVFFRKNQIGIEDDWGL